MLLYLREQCPSVEIVSSTNGIPLARQADATAIVRSGLDHLVFTIGGVRQRSYERYHVGGKVGAALEGLQNVCDTRAMFGATRPHVIWRYLLFHWNDSVEEVTAAIQLAALYGADIHLYLTSTPAHGLSYRFAPNTPEP